MTRLVTRMLCVLACACAATATFVVGAQASLPAAPDLVERFLQRQSLAEMRPDDRAGGRGLAPFESSPVIGASSVAASDFHWRDAGVAAGTVLALALAATGGLLVVRRYRAVVQ